MEIANIIFAPGFSTAQAVSDISGRGVGMDAVHFGWRRGGDVRLVLPAMTPAATIATSPH